jgi:hypothetical protein
MCRYNRHKTVLRAFTFMHQYHNLRCGQEITLAEIPERSAAEAMGSELQATRPSRERNLCRVSG